MRHQRRGSTVHSRLQDEFVLRVFELRSPSKVDVDAFRGTGERQYAHDGPSSFDVSPDGQRLLMIKEDEHAASATQIGVVLTLPVSCKT